jgi:hypothetical protein
MLTRLLAYWANTFRRDGVRKVSLVDDQHLEELLQSAGLSNAFKARELRCHSCEEPVNYNNFGGMMVLGGVPEVFCDRVECLSGIGT